MAEYRGNTPETPLMFGKEGLENERRRRELQEAYSRCITLIFNILALKRQIEEKERLMQQDRYNRLHGNSPQQKVGVLPPIAPVQNNNPSRSPYYEKPIIQPPEPYYDDPPPPKPPNQYYNNQANSPLPAARLEIVQAQPPQPLPQYYPAALPMQQQNSQNDKSFILLKNQMDQYNQNQRENNNLINDLKTRLYQLESELKNEKEWRKNYSKYNGDMKDVINGINNKTEHFEIARTNDVERLNNRIKLMEKSVYEIKMSFENMNQNYVSRMNEIENKVKDISINTNDLNNKLSLVNNNIDRLNMDLNGIRNSVNDLEGKMREAVINIVNDQMEQKVVIDATIQGNNNNNNAVLSNLGPDLGLAGVSAAAAGGGGVGVGVDFNKWSGVIQKLKLLENALSDEKKSRRLLDDSIRRIDNKYSDVLTTIKSQNDILQTYENHVQDTIDKGFGGYDIKLNNLAKNLEIRLNKYSKDIEDFKQEILEIESKLENYIISEMKNINSKDNEITNQLVSLSTRLQEISNMRMDNYDNNNNGNNNNNNIYKELNDLSKELNMIKDEIEDMRNNVINNNSNLSSARENGNNNEVISSKELKRIKNDLDNHNFRIKAIEGDYITKSQLEVGGYNIASANSALASDKSLKLEAIDNLRNEVVAQAVINDLYNQTNFELYEKHVTDVINKNLRRVGELDKKINKCIQSVDSLKYECEDKHRSLENEINNEAEINKNSIERNEEKVNRVQSEMSEQKVLINNEIKSQNEKLNRILNDIRENNETKKYVEKRINDIIVLIESKEVVNEMVEKVLIEESYNKLKDDTFQYYKDYYEKLEDAKKNMTMKIENYKNVTDEKLERIENTNNRRLDDCESDINELKVTVSNTKNEVNQQLDSNKKDMNYINKSMDSLSLTTAMDNIKWQIEFDNLYNFVDHANMSEIRTNYHSLQSYLDTSIKSFVNRFNKLESELDNRLIAIKMDMTKQIYERDLLLERNNISPVKPLAINTGNDALRPPTEDSTNHEAIYQYLFDENTGCYYFFNSETGATSWDPPEDLDIVIYREGQKLDGGYTVCRTTEGRLYKRNDRTGSIEPLYN